MKFVLYDDYVDIAIKEQRRVEYPDFEKSMYLWKLCSRLDETYSDSICQELNQINNQGLEEVIPSQFKYRVKGVTLPLQCLITGERVFLLGYACKALNERAYLHYGYNQLSPKSCRTFGNLFTDSDLYIMFNLAEDLNWYRG